MWLIFRDCAGVPSITPFPHEQAEAIRLVVRQLHRQSVYAESYGFITAAATHSQDRQFSVAVVSEPKLPLTLTSHW